MEYLYQFFLFLAQAATVLIVILIVLLAAATAGGRRGEGERGYLKITDVNERLKDYQEQLRAALLSPQEYKLSLIHI